LASRGPSESPLWEVPLTRTFTRGPIAFWTWSYRLIESSFLSKLKLIGILQASGIVKRYWLNFDSQGLEEMLHLLRKVRTMDLPCICFSVHSSKLVAGMTAFPATAEEERTLLAGIEKVFQMVSAWPDYQPATVSQVARQLEANYHARSRN
jgi:hypothetical protein